MYFFNISLLPNIKNYNEFRPFDSANEKIICQHCLYARRKEVLKQLIRNYQNSPFESGGFLNVLFYVLLSMILYL